MQYRVAFFPQHFCERGTEKTTYDFADFNEKILGNYSIIICFTEEKIRKLNFIQTKQFVKQKYKRRFKIYEINQISEIGSILKENKITHFYIQSHGFYRDIYNFTNKSIYGNCKTIYHCAFGPMARQGSTLRCIVGEYLNKRFSKNLPVLPPIVRPYIEYGNMRQLLGIPSDATVFGRHGGKDTFDINFVKEVIKYFVEANQNVYFLFLNTNKFHEHKRIIYLNNLSDREVLLFISSCNAMIHARLDGETFGLAPAEFSAANKPVITYGLSKDQEHLRILNKKAIIYNNKKDLIFIFKNISKILKKRKNWNAYKEFEPNKVIYQFKELLSNEPTRLTKIKNLFLDLPWEIKIYFFKVLIVTRISITKLIPKKYLKLLRIIFAKHK